jgi:hypothetical protein
MSNLYIPLIVVGAVSVVGGFALFMKVQKSKWPLRVLGLVLFGVGLFGLLTLPIFFGR